MTEQFVNFYWLAVVSSVVVIFLIAVSVLRTVIISESVVRFISGAIFLVLVLFFAKIFWCLWEIRLLFHILLAEWFCCWLHFWLPCLIGFVENFCHCVVPVAFMAVYFLTILADNCIWLAIFEAFYVVDACTAVVVSVLLECCEFELFESTFVISNIFLFGCWDPWKFTFIL